MLDCIVASCRLPVAAAGWLLDLIVAIIVERRIGCWKDLSVICAAEAIF
jgi:hypothetical protein